MSNEKYLFILNACQSFELVTNINIKLGNYIRLLQLKGTFSVVGENFNRGMPSQESHGIHLSLGKSGKSQGI